MSTSLYQIVIDARNEAFCGLNSATSTAPLWVEAVVVTSSGTVFAALDILGWEAGNDPASNYDATTIKTTEVDFY